MLLEFLRAVQRARIRRITMTIPVKSPLAFSPPMNMTIGTDVSPPWRSEIARVRNKMWLQTTAMIPLTSRLTNFPAL